MLVFKGVKFFKENKISDVVFGINKFRVSKVIIYEMRIIKEYLFRF